uniref:Molybdopterin biosynthesis protein n=1 Tax=Clostridioides difficile TaxID=1496 RepID=A0A381I751_CLODI|nr:molybdopterin biosynthesis protein [Clostridioides difficile]
MLQSVDFLITTGGVSVGDKDLIPDVFKKNRGNRIILEDKH